MGNACCGGRLNGNPKPKIKIAIIGAGLIKDDDDNDDDDDDDVNKAEILFYIQPYSIHKIAFLSQDLLVYLLFMLSLKPFF